MKMYVLIRHFCARYAEEEDDDQVIGITTSKEKADEWKNIPRIDSAYRSEVEEYEPEVFKDWW